MATQNPGSFRTGSGVGWHGQDEYVFTGCERFFRPGYLAKLVPSWLAALDGVEAKLGSGARAADVGCGHGACTVLMTRSYPNSDFTGALALLTAGTAAGAVIAGPVDSSHVIYDCYTDNPVNGSNALVLVLHDVGTTCPNGTMAIQWNQQGPAGPAGPQGPRVTPALPGRPGLPTLRARGRGYGRSVTIQAIGPTLARTALFR